MTQKRSISPGRLLLIIFLILTAVSIFAAWRFLSVPFGTLFNTFGYLALFGLFCTFATLAVMALRSGRLAWKTIGILPAIIALAVGLLTAGLFIDYKMIPGMSNPEGLSSGQWTEDLDSLAAWMEEIHPRLFEMVPRERFEIQVAELEREIPRLDENRIKWELYRIAALPNDAHTYFNIESDKLDWHLMPLKMWFFPEGLYVLDAGRDYRDLIGTRMVAVGNASIEEASARLRPYLAAESEQNWKERFCYMVIVTEALRAAGICEGSGPVEATFETRDGKRFTRRIRPAHYLPVFYWAMIRKTDNNTPYFLWNDPKDAYWFEYRTDTGTLYVQFNECVGESRAETIDRFLERLGAWIEANDFERCVIDIRKNGGGDSNVSLRLANLAIGNEKLDRPGRLFVLTSRKTFSAAVMFLSLMECRTGAVIVGEPTAQGPFFSARSRLATLPNSKIVFYISSFYNRCALIDDGRNSIGPDVPVEYTYEDHLAGRDPMMEAVLSYEPPAAAARIEPGEAERISGRYLFSPYQILTVELGEEELLRVDDFFEGSFRNVRTRIYPAGGGRFLTDIDGVELVFDQSFGQSTGVTLGWRGIKTYAERAPLDHRLPMELFAGGMIDEAAAAIYAQRDLYTSEVPGFEAALNRMGYTFLIDKKHDEAITVFALNVKLFPESANTYDSLGEAYMESGRTREAIENYEKALEINPASESAKRALERLRKTA